MTPKELSKLIKTKYPEQICKAINDTFAKYNINTPLRQRHFLAQIFHESGGLIYTTELSTGAQYENRKDLGNIYPGDGRKYKGRGFIQITGRFNYEKLSKDFGIDFINTPEKLAQNPFNMLSAGWFWNLKKLNNWADKNNIEKITRLINGGLNGFEDRKKWFTKISCVI
jgi:putative chitinase